MRIPLLPTLCLFAASVFFLPARGQSLSQLLKKLSTATTDSERADLYYSLSTRYWTGNTDSLLLLADLSLQAAKRDGYEKGVALALLSKGIGFGAKQEYSEALNCYLQALRISEQLKMDGLRSNLYDDMGNVYSHLKDYSRATEYHQDALKIAQRNGDRHETAVLLANIAENYKNMGAYDSALAYNVRALPIMESLHDSVVIAIILLNTGDDYNKKGQPEKALPYFQRCDAMAQRIGDAEDIAWSAVSVADSYRRQRRYALSIRQARAALDSARRLDLGELIEECYSVLYSAYRENGDFRQALDYRN
ncbi:MAG TPA: tetratricopeptide repeat protein, partial [Puia sp.]|nr:tetratricopeptide repeat protein [Puia sp.]